MATQTNTQNSLIIKVSPRRQSGQDLYEARVEGKDNLFAIGVSRKQALSNLMMITESKSLSKNIDDYEIVET
jgi:hypothetical protein